jgi:hypothetical protein
VVLIYSSMRIALSATCRFLCNRVCLAVHWEALIVVCLRHCLEVEILKRGQYSKFMDSKFESVVRMYTYKFC